MLITGCRASGCKTGILSYYLHLVNYSQPPHPEKPSLENNSSLPLGTQHSPASHGRDKGPFRAGTQGTGSSWVNRAGLVSRSCRWCPAVKQADPSHVGGGRQPGAAGKCAGNQLMQGRRQQQAQLVGRDAVSAIVSVVPSTSDPAPLAHILVPNSQHILQLHTKVCYHILPLQLRKLSDPTK